MEISQLVRRLNDSEISQYEDKGYIKGLPVFSKEGVKDLQKLFLKIQLHLKQHKMKILKNSSLLHHVLKK